MGHRETKKASGGKTPRALAERVMHMVGTGEGVESPDAMLKKADIEQDRGRREFFFLRIFAGQVAIFSAFDDTPALQDAARDAYTLAVSNYVEAMVRSFPDVSDSHVDAVFDDVNDHIQIYTQAVSHEHPRGAWYLVGKTYASLCGMANDESVAAFVAQYIKDFTDVIVRLAKEANLSAA